MLAQLYCLDSKIDQAVIMVATAVFITSAARKIVLGDQEIFLNICKLFERCLDSECSQVFEIILYLSSVINMLLYAYKFRLVIRDFLAYF